ncbi:MAG: TonB-dependent receptor plug domain-containing protein, partial [Muribaculaceae bacterium]|nr:TonB-dependent receptor plug domain-containing protein [Muribaculaceae bacterium]
MAASVPSSDTVVNLLPDVQVKGESLSRETTSATPMQAITAQEIKTRAITDISDAVRRLPGVTLRDYGGNGGLKTLSVRGLGSEHTAVLYDGVALSDCQSGQIDLSRYSLNNINGISLFSGDNDDLFIPARAAASASSLYIDSFKPDVTEEKGNNVRAQMKVGSFGFYNPYLRWEYSDGDGTAFSINGEYTHADNDYPFTLKNGNVYTKERREHSLMNSWHTEMSFRKQWKGKTVSGKLYYYDNSRDLPG